MNDKLSVLDDTKLSPAWAGAIDGCILDMDGVIYRGDTLIPEVPGFLAALDAAGVAWSMATNNATKTQRDYVEKLARMGIDAPEARIVTSAVATSSYLRHTYSSGTTIYVVGMDALREAIFGDGYFIPAGRDAQVVVSGANFDLRYNDLKIACLAIRAGADYVATNGDRTFPTEEGLIPGSGAIVAALVAATDAQPVVIGKPSPEMIRSCLELMGTTASRTLMIGDRLDTDIQAGINAGTQTLLVLTGVSTVADIQTFGIVPEVVVPTLAPVSDALGARNPKAAGR
ncbi:MAG TPA: HAD-IIA family hydrolase [Thermomicrobiales bacterium]|nr:HAD-IIA family hydrolase [Thermomicrobiales bacterium]